MQLTLSVKKFADTQVGKYHITASIRGWEYIVQMFHILQKRRGETSILNLCVSYNFRESFNFRELQLSA